MKGVAWMEQAVKQGTLDRSSLAVPYSNLASMQRKLGDQRSGPGISRKWPAGSRARS